MYKRSNNSESSNIGSTSLEEVAESSSSSAKKQKSSKDYEKTQSCGWDKNWRISCPRLEYAQAAQAYLVLVCCISPSIFSLKYSSNRAQTAHNTQVQGELKVGKLYFHNNGSILRFLRNGQIPNTKSYNGLHFASFTI